MALKIFEDKRHVFWQAFLLAILFFFIGLVGGVYLEQNHSDTLNSNFQKSEASLYDSFALGKLIDNPAVSCRQLVDANVQFADRIFSEAKVLDDYEDSTKLTEIVKIIHKKYDVLRTLLWINVISVREKCPSEFNTVIYLYLYDSEDVEVKSKQVVWSRILSDLKDSKGNEVLLIPIAADQGVDSLNALEKAYNVNQFPAVIVNEKKVLYDVESVGEFDDYFKD